MHTSDKAKASLSKTGRKILPPLGLRYRRCSSNVIAHPCARYCISDQLRVRPAAIWPIRHNRPDVAAVRPDRASDRLLLRSIFHAFCLSLLQSAGKAASRRPRRCASALLCIHVRPHYRTCNVTMHPRYITSTATMHPRYDASALLCVCATVHPPLLCVHTTLHLRYRSCNATVHPRCCASALPCMNDHAPTLSYIHHYRASAVTALPASRQTARERTDRRRTLANRPLFLRVRQI